MAVETEPFHVGVVVSDLDEAMRAYGGTLGLTWSSPQPREFTVWTPDGIVQASLLVTFSRQGPPSLELIRGHAGTPWEPAGLGQLHHVGYWASRFADDVERLQEQGCRLVATGVDAQGSWPSRFAYLRRGDGFRIELLDEAIRGEIEALIAGSGQGGKDART